MMKKILIGAAVITALAGSAHAAVITLQSIAPTAGGYTFSYQGTLGPDEGVRSGDSLVIYDFDGYVAGSIFSSNAAITATTELTTAGLIAPGQNDDPNITNLVFTYTGPDFRNVGGPFASLDFNGLGAVSTLRQTHLDAFTTVTTKNNPAPSENTAVFTLGTTQTPGAIPEPAAWALMVGGFGLVGAVARRRRVAVAA